MSRDVSLQARDSLSLSQKLGVLRAPICANLLYFLSVHSIFGLDIRVLRIVYTLAVCYLVYLLRGVLLLLILSVVAAYVLFPAVEGTYRFVTHKRHRAGTLVIVFLLILAILLSIGGVIGYYAFEQASALASQVPVLLEPGAVQHIQFPKFLRPWDAHIRHLIQNWRETHAKDLLETLTSVTMRLLRALGSVLSLVVVLVLSFLLLKNGASYVRSFVEFLPEPYQPAARSFFADVHQMMLHWTRAIVLVALATALLYAISFSLLGVPYSVLLAIMAFPFEFVPLIGPPAAFAIIMMVAFFSGYHHLLWLIGVFFLVRMIQDTAIQPFLMGSSRGVRLSPFVVIIGALAGGAIAGVPGLLLSIPVIATLRILYRVIGAGSQLEERAGAFYTLASKKAG